MCTIVAIDQTQEACPKAIGGIFALALGDLADVTAVTISGTSVTAVTGVTWVLFLHDKDGSAFFDQNGERPTQYVLKYISDGFVKFVDATDAKIATLLGLGCCSLIGIAFQNNSTNRLFGIDIDPTADFKESLEKHTITPSVKSGTSNEENRIEFVIAGMSENVLTTTITYDSIANPGP
jgi:hypothetical protein